MKTGINKYTRQEFDDRLQSASRCVFQNDIVDMVSDLCILAEHTFPEDIHSQNDPFWRVLEMNMFKFFAAGFICKRVQEHPISFEDYIDAPNLQAFIRAAVEKTISQTFDSVYESATPGITNPELQSVLKSFYQGSVIGNEKTLMSGFVEVLATLNSYIY